MPKFDFTVTNGTLSVHDLILKPWLHHDNSTRELIYLQFYVSRSEQTRDTYEKNASNCNQTYIINIFIMITMNTINSCKKINIPSTIHLLYIILNLLYNVIVNTFVIHTIKIHTMKSLIMSLSKKMHSFQSPDLIRQLRTK